MNEVEDSEEKEVCNLAIMTEYPSLKSIFKHSDEWPGQSATNFVKEMENQGNCLRGVVYNVLLIQEDQVVSTNIR